MTSREFTLIDAGEAKQVSARVSGGSVRLAPEALEAALGWRLETRGLCRGDVCVPVADRAGLARADGIDLAALAEALHRPLALDLEEGAAALGSDADERRRSLQSLEAPDFTLPDLDGRPHTLSHHRGKKVLLIAYASW